MQASLAILAKEQNETRYRALRSSDPNSPWSQCTSMRLNHQPLRVLQFYTDEDGKSSNPTELRVTCESKKDMGGYNVVVDVKGETHVFSDLKACVSDDSVVVIQSSDQTYQSRAVVDGEYVHLFPVVRPQTMLLFCPASKATMWIISIFIIATQVRIDGTKFKLFISDSSLDRLAKH
jgi:hypothetical protein